MAFYRTIALFVSFALIGASIYMFLEERDDDAKVFLFLAVYTYIGLFYSLKSMYYLRHRATFNEVSFVVFLPFVPIILVLLGDFTEIDELYFSEFLTAQITFQDETLDFFLSFSSILSLPYFGFSLYLLLRSFIRYQFIRLRGYSKGGLNAVFVGLLLSVIIGIAYLVLAIIMEDLLLALFGFIYAIVGIFGFLA
ncbi:MAG: hypothetical protein ACW98K_08950 [Candidatus Kariarchaeaceae archaeon]|jgi:hypothetical protein